MRGDRPRAPLRAALRTLAWLGAACAAAALVGAPPAGATDLTGRADLSYGNDDSLAASSDYLRQIYTLAYRRQVSTPTSYQLSLRYQDDRGETLAGGDRTRLRVRAFAPSASLDHRMEDFGTSLVFRLNEEATLDPATDAYAHRTIERISASAYVRPFERGQVTLAADRLAFRAGAIDTLDQRLGVAFRYSGGGLRLDNEFRVQRTDDAQLGHTRVSVGPRLSAAYARALGRDASLTAQYVLDYLVTEQDVRASGEVSVPVEVQPAGGLFLVDDLPLDTDPMLSEPRLVDRAFDASAGVSLGPGGVSFANVGLDMGRFVTLDELRLHLRDGSGIPLASGGPLTFTVYSSQDGLRWAPVDGLAVAFNPGLSAWVLRFAPTSARFFKAVTFGANTVETYATELQAFVHETVRPDATQTSSSVRQGLALGLSARPAEKLLVAFSGLLNADAVTPPGGARRWSTDVATSATAKLGPFGPLLYGAGQTFTYAREAGALTQSAFATSGSVRYRPVDRYETTLDARVRADRFERPFPALSVRTTTVGASLQNRLDPWDALRFTLVAGLDRQQLLGGGRTEYLTATGQARAEPWRDVSLRLESNVQRILSRQGDLSPLDQGLPVARIVTYQIHAAELRYQATSQLSLMARVGWAATAGGEGILQAYRAGWSPFPGGTVLLAFDYGEDVDPLTGQSFRRITAQPRWQVNRHTVLQLSYNNARGTGPSPVRQENLFVTLSLIL